MNIKKYERIIIICLQRMKTYAIIVDMINNNNITNGVNNMTTTLHFINLEAITCHIKGSINYATADFVNDMYKSWWDSDAFLNVHTRWENMID
jgi:hypothetical protein